MIELILPLAPTVNSYQPHTVRNGKAVRYFSDNAKKFKAHVKMMVKKLNANLKLSGRISMEIEIQPRDKRNQDIDNRIKPTLDALQEADVYLDDSQIDELVVRRGKVKKGGLMIVKLREI